jgi:hypothetical protein
MIEQGKDVQCALTKREVARRIRGSSVSAQIRHDHAVAIRITRKDVTPVIPDTQTAVEQEQRIT